VTKNERSANELQKLISKYPFSYYGMRLRSETAEYVWEWPYASKNENAEKESPFEEWILSSAHKNTWDRFIVLKEVGWSEESLLEIEALPQVQDPYLKAQLAKSFAGAKVYPPVIRYLNQAGDQADDLRSSAWVSLGFPKFYQEAVEKEAAKYNLSPFVILSLMRQESAFNPRAVSTSNAMGLMQMIPPTAREIAQDLKLKKVEIPRSLFVPELNIQMGTYYLGKLVKEFNQSVPMALAAYNAGPHRLKTFFRARNPKIEGLNLSLDPFAEIWMDELPWFETSYYVKAILRNYFIYQALDKGRVDLRKLIQEGLVLSPNSSAQVESQSKVH
jgi:soluble lytic murein transglycosylase